MPPVAHRNRTTLTEKQVAMIGYLVGDAMRIKDACAKAGVDKATLYKWQDQSPVFQRAYAEASRRHQETTWKRVSALAERAVDRLVEVLDAPKTPPSVRVQAAQALLALRRPDEAAAPTQPYQSREEMVTALASMPADVLAKAAARAGGVAEAK